MLCAQGRTDSDGDRRKLDHSDGWSTRSEMAILIGPGLEKAEDTQTA
jgi:hypothetical protein